MTERKDELIAALEEMVRDLTSKIINLRVDAGLALKAKSDEIAELKKTGNNNGG